MKDGDAAPAVDVRGLCMRYGAQDVLNGVDLRVERGEILALLGPNGAGKTTTIEILEGFRRRTEGHVRVLGVDPETGGERWRARLGIVLQYWRDHRRWRVRELLDHIGRYYRAYGTPDRPRPYPADELLARVGLTGQASKVVGDLSGGQRRRLDVAIGLVGNPELLFLDEPTVGFDPEARHDFHQLVRDISAKNDTSIVLTTHDLAEAETLAHTIAILIDGRIAARGTPRELSARYSESVNVSYRRRGDDHRVAVPEYAAVDYVRRLLDGDPGISELEVRRSSFEEAYLSMVRSLGSARRVLDDAVRPR
ncbi:ABC transporter ATP-binding protein [Nonomuraea sp. NPDC052634]|uniref:ABC transporter ATP-binding protein n=1 Tax=Nonomuraea sp. NPDC052634 TaxID=3155813 RepID=UPI003433CAF2